MPSRLASTALLVLLACLARPGTGRAQFETLPRLGLSASPTAYVDTVEVDQSRSFTLYACVFGPEEGAPIGHSLVTVPWVIHQVCCGASIDILNVQYNPELTHDGSPLSGVWSTSEECLDRESLWLATLEVRLNAPEAGDYLWASGPAGGVVECGGTTPWFQGLPVMIQARGELVADDGRSFGSIKAMFR
ncbi:MAG: hypothetical protein AB7V45_16230 [Candidatus Krumholzibacteriia bacterium]